jgi:hypothetical protein
MSSRSRLSSFEETGLTDIVVESTYHTAGRLLEGNCYSMGPKAMSVEYKVLA